MAANIWQTLKYLANVDIIQMITLPLTYIYIYIYIGLRGLCSFGDVTTAGGFAVRAVSELA